LIDRKKYPPLNLPPTKAKVRSVDGLIQIFDQNRQKFINLTPEEWVRQHYLNYLKEAKSVGPANILTEFKVEYGNVVKRPDIAVINSDHSYWLIAECKAPTVKITEDTLQQVLTYASVINPRLVALTNGLHHFYFEFRPDLGKFVSIKDLPEHK